MAINTGPRQRSRVWSRLIAATYPHLQGIYYPSSMHANKPSVALYQNARPAIPASPIFNRALSDPALASRVGSAARALGYSVV